LTNKERPKINVSNRREVHLELEMFQNKVLRPILKMQHDIILKTFHNHIEKSSIKWTKLNQIKKIKCINDELSKNLQIKHLIIGLIVGHLNDLELDQYLRNTKEYNKRIIQMTKQRIQSTINF
tara:strand:- start:4401 stop:4769 length:369 start_codon:yes stop_codon:yes gene_type:complete